MYKEKANELSIEEKAKRYDEAICKLRGMIPNWERLSYNGKTFLQDLIYILPELKESEDERIREWLINLVKSHTEWLEDRIKEQLSNGQIYGGELNKAKDAIAWLERKSEQKPAEEYNITGIGSKNAQGKLGEMIKNLKPVNEVLEQKPAENKDYSAPLDIKIPFGAKDSELIQETIRIPDGCYAFIEGNEIVIKKGEKPAWSEEDERTYRSIIYSFVHNFPLVIPQQEFVKSLKDRYTWKPSDEQMGALANTCDGKILNLDYLNSLYQDLKKLKKGE